MNERASDARMWRLMDLAATEIISVRCPCGRRVEFLPGVLQRLHRVSSASLIYDLQYRFRCQACHRHDGFRIVVEDVTMRGNNGGSRAEVVVVE